VNKSKSGIVPIKGSEFQIGQTINEYPIVECYKYLGLMLNGKLDI
jgi:hypothetical protein